MPTWNEIDFSITERTLRGEAPEHVCDDLRKQSLRDLSAYTKRPVISYYSGFLQKKQGAELTITDFDMNGFMAVIHNLERKEGLDLILHTPGGAIEAARALVEYLYSMFEDKDIRVIVPQLAMSAGTMIACASRTIVMGKHSCLGPTDPQVSHLPALGVLSEIDRAIEEIRKDKDRLYLWREVFAKFPPAFVSNCERSVAGTKEMVKVWLAGNMLSAEEAPEKLAGSIVEHLMNYKETTEHGQHFLKDKCKGFGLKIQDLEADQGLQELVLTIHHCYVSTFARTRAIKMIENSNGSSWAVNA